MALIHSGEFRKYFYPDTKDPNALVFDGPTNADTKKAPEKPKVPADNDIDEEYDLNVRFGDGCPDGFYRFNNRCYPRSYNPLNK